MTAKVFPYVDEDGDTIIAEFVACLTCGDWITAPLERCSCDQPTGEGGDDA